MIGDNDEEAGFVKEDGTMITPRLVGDHDEEGGC